MRRILLILAILAMAISVEAATLNYTIQWDPNVEPDMKEYRIYRVDGARAWLGTVQHPTVTFDGTLTLPENTTGIFRVIVTAVDTSNNESADSLPAEYAWTTVDTTAPGTPRNIIIIIRTQ